LATIIDPAGNVTRLERDSQGRVIQISDPGGRGALHLTYDPATSRLTSISDWLNPPRVITFGYDSQNRLASVTNRNGEVTHYAYDGDGMHLSSIVDARGHEALAVTYDPISRVMRQCNAVTVQTGHCNTFEYKLGADGSFVQTIQESPTGYDPTWQPVLVNYYDSAGREVKSVLSPTAKGDPVVTYFSFGVNATKASTTEQGGIVPPPLTPHSIVGLAEVAKLPRPPDVQPVRAIRAITAIGRQLPPTEVTRDPFGRVVQFVVGSSAATSVGIKAGTVQVAYDAEDRPTQLKIQPSGGGDTTTLGFDYDAVGNLVSATASGVQVARYKYDERDSMVLMQTASGQTQTFTYDERGYLASEEVQDPDTSTDELVRWAYDGAGRLRRLEDYPQWPAKTAAKIVEYSYDGTRRGNAYSVSP